MLRVREVGGGGCGKGACAAGFARGGDWGWSGGAVGEGEGEVGVGESAIWEGLDRGGDWLGLGLGLLGEVGREGGGWVTVDRWWGEVEVGSWGDRGGGGGGRVRESGGRRERR